MITKSTDEARRLNSLAGECIQKQDFAGAVENFARALEHLPDEERDARARILNNMGHANVRLKQLDDALELFREAAGIFKEIGDDVGLGEQLGNMGSVYRDMQEWDRALPSYLDSLEIFEKIDHKHGMAAQYSNISYAYSGKGALQEALDYAIKAKELFDQLADTRRADLSQQNLDALKVALEGG